LDAKEKFLIQSKVKNAFSITLEPNREEAVYRAAQIL